MWTDAFEQLVRDHLMLGTDQLLEPDRPLSQYGLDSMRTVSLLVAIEQSYQVTFPDELLVPATFATTDALWTALAALLVAGADV